jgi:signal transduction histidine kinase
MRTSADPERLELLVHELRSPVAALLAISEALTGDSHDAASIRELTSLALAACRSATRIVEDSAVGPLQCAEVDAGALVRGAAAAAALDGGRVRSSVQDDLPRLWADEVRLRQALDNLVRNALVHSGSDEVVVSAYRDGDSVVFSVADKGRGIAHAEQKRIFERGARMAKSNPGSGLGLSLTRAIARAHGGTLCVDSAPSSGATFRIGLPLAGMSSTDAE